MRYLEVVRGDKRTYYIEHMFAKEYKVDIEVPEDVSESGYMTVFTGKYDQCKQYANEWVEIEREESFNL